MQRLAILGSTGSIGVSTLDVVGMHPEQFSVVALTASRNVELLYTQCLRFKPRYAVMADAAAAHDLKNRCKAAGLAVEVLAGPEAIVQVAALPDVDSVMAAIVGAAGLASCLAAALHGKRLLLANKEALVVGGQLFMDAVRTGGATLLPIDSEHSAIFQSLPADASRWHTLVDKLILTASGGPFRSRDPATFTEITPDQACAHPNWVMGRKISVDSATMMNKALEVIEARFLFDVAPEKIEVVIHPQSVIHSMVQFVDHSVVAQLGTPDMRGPIAYGLAWPERIKSGAEPIDFTRLAGLTFEAADSPAHRARYPGLRLAWQAMQGPSGATAVLNAANEVAVEQFLAGSLRFDHIHRVNQQTLDAFRFDAPGSLADLLDIDQRAREFARASIGRLAR